MLDSLFKQSLEVDIHRCYSKKLQISQESTCVRVFFNKVAGPQNCNFIKRDSNTGYFLRNL